MRLSGKSGRVYGPVGQSRTMLPVGSFGTWHLVVTSNVRSVEHLGAFRARAADPATIDGRGEGWREDVWYWPALSPSPLFEVEVETAHDRWRFPALVAFTSSGNLTFKSTGQATVTAKTAK